MKSALSEVRRARPLLGTFVEITAGGANESTVHYAIDEAFAAVGEVHRLMSFHDVTSDISRLNREAARMPVRIHQWTEAVLRSAKDFSQESDGAFDVTVASTLCAWQFLPASGPCDSTGNWRDIIFVGDHRVRFARPVLIDVGGIAKGFAVDRATEALLAAGASSGIVNAGGDLRVFGPKSRWVQIRHPRHPAIVGKTVLLRESSLATSALYFSRSNESRLNPMIDGRTQRPATSEASVSVYASDCMTADALTKIVFALGDNASSILDKHLAGSFLLNADSSFRDCNAGPESE